MNRLFTARPVATLAAGLIAAGAAACSDTRTVLGDCIEVYGGDVCTWAEMSGPTVTALGVDFPLASAQGAPSELRMVWPPEPVAVLMFPAGVEEATGFSHFELNWEHRGHPPETFMEPHFDFHFYTIDKEELEAIYCTDTSKPEALPAGYVLPDAIDPEHGLLTGLCVPAMGMHAMPRAQLESASKFTATMLMGYYAGDMIFIEPMISRSALLRQLSFELEVPAPPAPVEGVLVPARFAATFDEARGVYRMAFTGFEGQ